MGFNGGKMYHIFKIVNNLYINEFHSEEAKQAFLKGTFYIKVDGANGYHLDGVLYERYDDRKGKLDPDNLPEGIICIPEGNNPSKYEGHSYYYSKLDKNTSSKKLKKLYTQLYDKLDEEEEKNGTIELVGPNFQQTPGFTENMIINHTTLYFEFPHERTFENVKKFLLDGFEEGIVIEHKGKYWKIRANVFDTPGNKKCKYERYKKAWMKSQKNKTLTEEEEKLLEEGQMTDENCNQVD